MRISLLTVPVEPDPNDFEQAVSSDLETFSQQSRLITTLPIMPKIAIISLIKWMERHGYTKNMYDYFDVDMLLPTDKELEDYFAEYNPTVIGLSAVVSTCYSQVRRISKIARSVCPDAWIVVGGSITAAANTVLRKTDADICVVGDGEITWVDFLDYVKKYEREKKDEALAQIKGISYLDSQNELCFTGYRNAIPGELNPYPDYDILLAGLRDRPEEMKNYFIHWQKSLKHIKSDSRSWEPNRRPNLAQLWTTKGCTARCTFCQRSTKGFRVHDTETLDEHLAMLKERFDVGFIHILDETFGSDKKHAYAVATIMKKHDMLWMAGGVRCASVEYKDIKFYKEHNCTSLKFGVESGSQKILDVMEKNFTLETLENALTGCAELEVYSPLAVMVGMPGETNKTVQETGKFLGKISHIQGLNPRINHISIFYALPLPGTPLYIYGQQIGVIGKSPEEEEKYLLTVSGTGASKMNYVNLNGAKKKDLLFWEWLIRLEAQRTYLELEKKSPRTETTFLHQIVLQDRKAIGVGEPLSFWDIVKRIRNLGRKSGRSRKFKLFYGIDFLLNRSILATDRIHLLPRWLGYGIVRNILYLQYLLQAALLKTMGREFNLYSIKQGVKPLADDRILSPRHNRSLRTVVYENAKSTGPKASAEEAQDILGIGL